MYDSSFLSRQNISTGLSASASEIGSVFALGLGLGTARKVPRYVLYIFVKAKRRRLPKIGAPQRIEQQNSVLLHV